MSVPVLAVSPHPLTAAPFALMLLAVALLPLAPRAAGWWHANASKVLVSAALSLVTIVVYAAGAGHRGDEPGLAPVLVLLDHAIVADYVPFTITLVALYTIAGGIELSGRIRGRPAVNLAILAAGTVLASAIGTTGAAVLLVRPLLRANAGRTRVVHTVLFFIYTVCNCGGLLLPIGDPPLLLGYLRGVPFTWTLSLLPEWLLVNGALLAAYWVWDRAAFAREPESAKRGAGAADGAPFRIEGARNFVLLAIVVFAIAAVDPSRPVPGTSWRPPPYLRATIAVVCTALSLRPGWFTPRGLRERAGFDFHPIAEVAALFLGIFVTIQPVLGLLKDPELIARLGLRTPAGFYFTTGALSAFLDNAPTYVVFFETAKVFHPGDAAVALAGGESVSPSLLAAVSCASVFFGAVTYVGNGPNFLVKAIAERSGVKMPTFFAYLFWSAVVLVPVLAAAALLLPS
jgi:Na+/H+ antiporter NhaD/arsenite permease-like protein